LKERDFQLVEALVHGLDEQDLLAFFGDRSLHL